MCDTTSMSGRAKYDGFTNIAHSQCSHFGVDPSVCDEHWIDVNPVKMMLGKEQLKVCVIRSHRYASILSVDRSGRKIPRRGGIRIDRRSRGNVVSLWILESPQNGDDARSGLGHCGLRYRRHQSDGGAGHRGGYQASLRFDGAWDFCPNVDFCRPGVYDGDAVREFLVAASRNTSVRDALVAEAHKAQAAANVPPAVQDAPKLKPAAKAPAISGIRKEAAQG